MTTPTPKQEYSLESEFYEDNDPRIQWGDVFGRVWRKKWQVLLTAVMGAGASFGIAQVIPPVYIAKTVVLPPQQQSSAASALGAAGGALASLVPGLSGTKSSAEQYIALLGSVTITDKLIDRFKLTEVYEKDYKSDARKKLITNTVLTGGKRDGLIAIEVKDKDPVRAADIANAYVDYLRDLTNNLAVTEAQQRRQFFEQKLKETQAKLVAAQGNLQSSGLGLDVIKAEPRAAVEGQARIKAEITAAEVKYQAMRRILADKAPELQQQEAILSALRSELTKLEAPQSSGDARDKKADSGYLGRYREFKYQETLFELYARQYELARADESREGGLIQIVDPAFPPDKKDWPKPFWFLGGGAVVFLLVGAAVAQIEKKKK